MLEIWSQLIRDLAVDWVLPVAAVVGVAVGIFLVGSIWSRLEEGRRLFWCGMWAALLHVLTFAGLHRLPGTRPANDIPAVEKRVPIELQVASDASGNEPNLLSEVQPELAITPTQIEPTPSDEVESVDRPSAPPAELFTPPAPTLDEMPAVENSPALANLDTPPALPIETTPAREPSPEQSLSTERRSEDEELTRPKSAAPENETAPTTRQEADLATPSEASLPLPLDAAEAPSATTKTVAPADTNDATLTRPANPVDEMTRRDPAAKEAEIEPIVPPSRTLDDAAEIAPPAPPAPTVDAPNFAEAPADNVTIVERPLVPEEPAVRPRREEDVPQPTRSSRSAPIEEPLLTQPRSTATDAIETAPVPIAPPAASTGSEDFAAPAAPPPTKPANVPRRFDLDMELAKRTAGESLSRPTSPSRDASAEAPLPSPSSALGDVDSPNFNPYENRIAPNRLDIVYRHGGSEKTEQAVAMALEWLAAHQSEDGRWDSDGFERQCPEGDICTGHAIEQQSDTGLTALALLAFQGAGHTHVGKTKYRETVRRGLSWLMRTQRPDGDLQFGGRIYCHAMATLVLCEALAMTKDQRLRPAAQKAVSWLAEAQHVESGGWRYGPRQFGDTSVFGWALLALRSAKFAELEVPSSTWSAAGRWLPLVTLGQRGGLASYRPGYPPSHSMTAEALFCRQVLNQAVDPDRIEEAADYVGLRLPDASEPDIYYWYYGTLAMFQLGGNRWDRWNQRLTATLLETQRSTGHARGSWDPQRPFGVDGGRVFQTAASAMCLEVYYRYLPLYRRDG